MSLLVSLHDVTPAHAERLERAEAMLAAAGIEQAAYLLVPDFHRRHPLARDRGFAAWCRRRRPFAVDWVLHGYQHLDDGRPVRPGWREAFARRFMTGGEGEFLSLDAAVQHERLRAGRQLVTEIVGVPPRAFVAPAWLFNQTLVPALAGLGFHYTENHAGVIDVATGVTRRCPVVCWATRTTIRRVGSRIVCPVAFALFRREPAIRFAIHPFDMDHPRTVDQIRRLLDAGLERRRAGGYDDLFAA